MIKAKNFYSKTFIRLTQINNKLNNGRPAKRGKRQNDINQWAKV